MSTASKSFVAEALSAPKPRFMERESARPLGRLAVWLQIGVVYGLIFPLGVVHAGLGIIVAASFPDAVMHHMRVGIGFIRFHS